MRSIPADQWAKSSHEAERARVKLDAASELLDRLLPLFAATILRIREAEQGQPGAQAYDSDQVSGTPGRRDPLRYDENGNLRPDAARRDESEFIGSAEAAVWAVERLARIATAYAPREASSMRRRQAEAENRLICEGCSGKIPTRDGSGPLRCELDVGTEPTTVAGRLAIPMRLCRWHRDFVTRTADVEGAGRTATELELIRHHHHGKPIQLKAAS